MKRLFLVCGQVITDVIDDLVEQYGIPKKLPPRWYIPAVSIFSNMDPRVQAAWTAFTAIWSNLPYVSKKSGSASVGITGSTPKPGRWWRRRRHGERRAARLESGFKQLRPTALDQAISVLPPALELGLSSNRDMTPRLT